MGDGRLIAKRRKTFLESTSDRHRPMTSASAADSNIHIAAAFSFEERNEELKEAFQLPDERHGIRIGQHIVSHSRIFPGQWLEVWHKKRVPQKPDIEQEVDVVWHTELETKCHQRDRQPARRTLLPELPSQQLSQLMDRQVRGIDDTVGMATKISETLLFKPHSFQYRKMRQQRMGPPRLRESPNEHLLTRFKKYQLDRVTKSLHSLKNPYEIRKEYALPDIDTERNILNLAPLLMTQLDKSRQKRRRQIVDTEIPDIFEALEGMRLP